MAQQPRNWARASKLWFPIRTLPRGGTPAVLANEDQTVQWFVDKPNKTAIQHKRHLQDEDGRFRYEHRQPVIETTTVKPAWWSPAVYVDDRGEPVHE